jgi:hypothetical protein
MVFRRITRIIEVVLNERAVLQKREKRLQTLYFKKDFISLSYY